MVAHGGRRTGSLGALVMLASAASLLVYGLKSLRHSSSTGFVAAPATGAGRRQAISAVLPGCAVVTGMAPAWAETKAAPAAKAAAAPAAKAAPAPAPPPAPQGITDATFPKSGPASASFTLPAELKFKFIGNYEGAGVFESSKGKGDFYTQDGDQGAFVYVGQPINLKNLANDICRPSFKGPPGIMMKQYELSNTIDNLEYIELPLTDPNSGEGPYYWLLGGLSRNWKRHFWFKTLKSNGKEIMMAVGLPLQVKLPIDRKKEEKETKLMADAMSSFKLA
jgi:hypothetical protein